MTAVGEQAAPQAAVDRVAADPRLFTSVHPGERRVAPLLTDSTTPFWTGGQDGQLLIARCASCRTWLHPPYPVCRTCGSRDIGHEAVSGRGTVLAYTVNRQQWGAEPTPPYVVAIVELEGPEGVRLTTNVVECEVDEVTIGMPVTVCFAPFADVWLPMFRPSSQREEAAER